MSNYTKSTNFAAKDSLPSGNANKVVKGTEINTEFDNIATAITSKADLNSPTLVTPNLGTPSAAVLTNATGLPLTTGVTGTLLVANGGTGTNTFSAGALLKGAGTSAITTATAGTDYAAATTGTSAQLLANNGSGGFSNVTVGSGLSLSAGTLSTTGGASISAGDSNVTVSDTGSNGTVTVQTDGSERMRIDSSGKVGIGVTPSTGPGFSQRLQIKQADGIYSGLQIQKSDDDSILGVGYWTTPAAFSFVATYTSTGSYLPISFYTNNAENLRINTNGTIKTSSTISVGNATPSASGAGITFPATQSASSDANTLDDYEEGTWTPTGTGITLSAAIGYYTKIGRLVAVQYDITFPSTSNTGSADISGLPFTVSQNNSSNSAGAGSIHYYNGSINPLQMYLGGQTTAFRFISFATNKSNADMSGVRVTGQIIYYV